MSISYNEESLFIFSVLFTGKNPIKQNSFADIPEAIKPVIKAQGPGIGTIFILFSIVFC